MRMLSTAEVVHVVASSTAAACLCVPAPARPALRSASAIHPSSFELAFLYRDMAEKERRNGWAGEAAELAFLTGIRRKRNASWEGERPGGQ